MAWKPLDAGCGRACHIPDREVGGEKKTSHCARRIVAYVPSFVVPGPKLSSKGSTDEIILQSNACGPAVDCLSCNSSIYCES
jgi:hypothetical protein